MRNIADLRAILFKELEALPNNPTDADIDRIRLKCALADRVIDITRLEVQLAAVMKGALDVPFIENQAEERSPKNAPQLPAPRQTPLERAASVLSSGPSENHSWRKSSRHDRS